MFKMLSSPKILHFCVNLTLSFVTFLKFSMSDGIKTVDKLNAAYLLLYNSKFSSLSFAEGHQTWALYGLFS